jgi:hypothetical protein
MRQPPCRRSVRDGRFARWLLLGSRGWLVGFGTETIGWLIYVPALRLAPLSLVQAVNSYDCQVVSGVAFCMTR